MAIRNIGVDRWQVDISRGRKLSRHRHVVNGSEEQAHTYEVNFQAEWRKKKNKSRWTVAHVWELYEPWIRQNNRCSNPRSVDTRIQVLERVCEALGHCMIDDIPFEVLKAYQTKRIEQIRENMTKRNMRVDKFSGHRMVNLELFYLYGMSKWACDPAEHETPLAAARITKIKRLKENISLPKPIPMPIVERLLDVMDPEHRAMCLLMCVAGLRSHEAFALRKENIFWDNNYGVVISKGGEPGSFVIIDVLRKALEAVPGIKEGQGLVFPPRPSTKKYDTRQDIRATIKTAKAKAGIPIPIRPHMLRHTFASQNLLKSGNLKLVKEAMRHKKIESTQIYTEVLVSQIRDMVDATFKK
ncbi:MAG: site-specific integrase [Syntrophorhabdales bacterium]